MASPSLVMQPAPPAGWVRPMRPIQVQWIARFGFYTVYLASLMNVAALFTRYNSRVADQSYEAPSYPFIFAVGMLLVLTFTRGRGMSTYLWVAWGFWLVYALMGFIGQYQKTAISLYFIAKFVFKPWMSMVGLPWMAIRAISEDKLDRFIKTTVIATSIGAFLAMVQVVLPQPFSKFVTEPGRGSGFWINPNHCGGLCASVLMFSLIAPFSSKLVTTTLRLLLIGGVIASFSRSGLLCLLIGAIVYGVSTKQLSVLLKSLAAVLAIGLCLLVAINVLAPRSPELQHRLATIKAFITLDLQAEGNDNRSGVWREAARTIIERGGLIIGLGHGSMERIVEVGAGLSPHNYYLFVWGNSGLFALLGLLVYQFMLVEQSLRCTAVRTRAALTAVALMLAFMQIFDHSWYGSPGPGAVVTVLAVAFFYGRQMAPRGRFIQANPRLPRGAFPAPRRSH